MIFIGTYFGFVYVRSIRCILEDDLQCFSGVVPADLRWESSVMHALNSYTLCQCISHSCLSLSCFLQYLTRISRVCFVEVFVGQDLLVILIDVDLAERCWHFFKIWLWSSSQSQSITWRIKTIGRCFFVKIITSYADNKFNLPKFEEEKDCCAWITFRRFVPSLFRGFLPRCWFNVFFTSLAPPWLILLVWSWSLRELSIYTVTRQVLAGETVHWGVYFPSRCSLFY